MAALRFLGWATFALVLAALLVEVSRAEERPYEITLLAKELQLDRPNIWTLAPRYESREECLNAIVRVKVMVSGARLVCQPAGKP